MYRAPDGEPARDEAVGQQAGPVQHVEDGMGDERDGDPLQRLVRIPQGREQRHDEEADGQGHVQARARHGVVSGGEPDIGAGREREHDGARLGEPELRHEPVGSPGRQAQRAPGHPGDHAHRREGGEEDETGPFSEWHGHEPWSPANPTGAGSVKRVTHRARSPGTRRTRGRSPASHRHGRRVASDGRHARTGGTSGE
jgi:hypothetical protein